MQEPQEQEGKKTALTPPCILRGETPERLAQLRQMYTTKLAWFAERVAQKKVKPIVAAKKKRRGGH